MPDDDTDDTETAQDRWATKEHVRELQATVARLENERKVLIDHIAALKQKAK